VIDVAFTRADLRRADLGNSPIEATRRYGHQLVLATAGVAIIGDHVAIDTSDTVNAMIETEDLLSR